MGNEENKSPIQRKITNPFEENGNFSEENDIKNKFNYASARIGSFHLKKEQFIGQLVRGKKEGKGICYYKNGDKYDGNFKDDKKEGKGSFFYNEKGEIYQGNFANDYPNGIGKYFFKNGDRYEGMFKDGKMHGEGTIFFGNGGRYKGEFKNDLRHGKGEFKNEFGQTKYEFWDNGILKQNNPDENIKENESVSLLNERDTKKFEEFFKDTYKKKSLDKMPLLNRIKQIKEKYKNKINDYQLVQILNYIKDKPNAKSWSIEDVKILFQNIGMEKCVNYIDENSIDGKKLLFLDNSSISNIFKIKDKNETRNIGALIEFIGDISINEQEKNNIENKSTNKIYKRNSISINNNNNNNIINNNNIEKIDIKNKDKIHNNLDLNQIKRLEIEKNKKKLDSYSNTLEQPLSKNKDEIFIKELNKLGKSEFTSSLNNDSLNFFINYDEIKKETTVVGEGGSGIVILGEWQGKKVTLKKSKLNYNEKGNIFISKTFINEINIMASLRHPNILLFMGVTIDDNTYYMINEYLIGGNLYDYMHIKRKKLNEQQKIKIALQIALALKYIHSQNILHCDLKSSNVFLDENFNAKLADFGFSYIMNEEPKRAVGGTYNWMAPEILNGEKYEKTADIFSYGIILWELLTRKIPNPGIPKDLFKDYINHKIRNKEDIIPFPKEGNIVLRCISSKCLMIKPEDRISLDNIIKYLTKANKCYEEVDEAILEMYNFVS